MKNETGRQEGFYWVKLDDPISPDWTVALYYDNDGGFDGGDWTWKVAGERYGDYDFVKINETRIPTPDENIVYPDEPLLLKFGKEYFGQTRIDWHQEDQKIIAQLKEMFGIPLQPAPVKVFESDTQTVYQLSTPEKPTSETNINPFFDTTLGEKYEPTDGWGRKFDEDRNRNPFTDPIQITSAKQAADLYGCGGVIPPIKTAQPIFENELPEITDDHRKAIIEIVVSGDEMYDGIKSDILNAIGKKIYYSSSFGLILGYIMIGSISIPGTIHSLYVKRENNTIGSGIEVTWKNSNTLSVRIDTTDKSHEQEKETGA